MSRRRQSWTPCPTATKVAFPSQEDAEERISAIREADEDPIRTYKPVRAYLCDCGKWHLTSREMEY